MSVIIFIIVLGVLIFVHELGHFSIAKWAKIRVDEFAVGFPPRIISFVKGQTRYALNLIPFGGYVKIFGENPDEDSLNPDASDSFVNKNRWIQAAVLVAGVMFNILFAWLLFSISFMSGFPAIVTEENRSQVFAPEVVITSVLKDGPAAAAGMKAGDRVHAITVEDVALLTQPTVEGVQSFIREYGNQEMHIQIARGGNDMQIVVQATDGVIEDQPAIGVTLNMIGEMKLGFFGALKEGAYTTVTMTRDIAVGLALFLNDMFRGQAELNQVAGPVGIVGLVGDASQFGFIYLLGFTAFISLNLAVLNMVPFPALDGGRLLFILIEGITRRRIKPVVANTINAIGFIALIALMVIITVSDVIKLF